MPARVVRVPDYVLVRVVDNELVVLNLDNEEYYGLDEIGTTIWEAVTTAPSVEGAVAQLLEQYDVAADVLAQDVDALLEQLRTRGLVELDPT